MTSTSLTENSTFVSGLTATTNYETTAELITYTVIHTESNTTLFQSNPTLATTDDAIEASGNTSQESTTQDNESNTTLFQSNPTLATTDDAIEASGNTSQESTTQDNDYTTETTYISTATQVVTDYESSTTDETTAINATYVSTNTPELATNTTQFNSFPITNSTIITSTSQTTTIQEDTSSSSNLVTNSSTSVNTTTRPSNLIFNLEVWQFSIIVAGSALALIFILLIVICVCRKRKKGKSNKKKGMDQYWAEPTFENNIDLVKMSPLSERRNSEELPEEETTIITTPVVNVFENAEEDSTSQKKLKHSPSLMKSNSLRSNSSTLSKVSDKEAPLQRKAKKTLTKVEMPTLDMSKLNETIQETDDTTDNSNANDKLNHSKPKTSENQGNNSFLYDESPAFKTVENEELSSSSTVPPPPPPPATTNSTDTPASSHSTVPPPPPPPPPPPSS